MSEKEVIEQLESLIEAWYLKEADLNQTDINAIRSLLQENQQLKEKLKQRDEVIDRAKKQTHFIDEQLKKYVTLIPSKEIADLLDILNNKGDNK